MRQQHLPKLGQWWIVAAACCFFAQPPALAAIPAPRARAVRSPRTQAARSPRTQAARSLTIDDTGHLRLIHASGQVLSEAGAISGTLPGTAKVSLNVGETVTASFTIYAHDGSITGHGHATLHSSGRYSSFGGTLSVTGGTGRFAHAHGSGELYGAIERKSDALTVQTRGGKLYY